MRPFAGALFRTLALALFAGFLIASLPQTFRYTRYRIALAASALGEDPSVERRRILGERWVGAIDGIRRTIPADGEYLLVNGGKDWEAGPYWVRFELAPRRARFLGRLAELPDGATLRGSLPPGRFVVIAYREPRPPKLMDREVFLRALDRRHGRS